MGNFWVIPAVDILNGRCVRLYKGDYEQVTDYGDPLELATRWSQQGIEWLHVVDLDGARTGKPAALNIAAQIRSQTGCKVQFGGGLRAADTAYRALEYVDRIILSSWAFRDPEGVEKLCNEVPDRVLISLDVKDGKAWGDGWHTPLADNPSQWARRFTAAGAAGIIVTNIEGDGTLSGVTAEQVKAVSTWSVPFYWAGGIANAKDVLTIKEAGGEFARGAVVGRALYAGATSISDILTLLN